MLSSEQRSLFRFLSIYLSSTFILFFLATFIFYTFQKHQIIDMQNNKLSVEAEHIVQELRQLHETFDAPLLYPQHQRIDSAIYNLDKEFIFGTFNFKNIHWNQEYYKKGNRLFYIRTVRPYYLGASFLILSQELNYSPLNKLFKMSALFLLIAGIIFTLLGLFLGKLFIAPMKDSIEQMNKFIEDTTHELNTPISTILTNIELLDTIHDCDGKKEMRRIEVASKTLSRLYEDLTYLKLNHKYHREIIKLDLSQLVEERLEFFSTLIESKELHLLKELHPNIILNIDKNDAIRLVDNILSNAIKYNKKSGDLIISLQNNSLKVKNSGLGIKSEEIHFIQKRFKRANKSEGGFGIGLDIIGQVVESYGFDFNISSKYNHYTEVSIKWNDS